MAQRQQCHSRPGKLLNNLSLSSIDRFASPVDADHQVNFTVDIRAMDDQVRETIVASFSRIVMQRCDHRLVDCAVEHKVRELKHHFTVARELNHLTVALCTCSTRRRLRRATQI